MRVPRLVLALICSLLFAACPDGAADGPSDDAGENGDGDGDANGDGDGDGDADAGTSEPVPCLEAHDGDPCATDDESCLQCDQAGSTCGGCSAATCQDGSWQVLPPPPDCPCGGFVLADRLGQTCTQEGETCKETDDSCDAARCTDGTWTAVDVTAFSRCGDGPACGDASCHWSEYCSRVLPGIPDGQTTYSCLAGPEACDGERPTCACLGCGDCTEDDDGATCTAAAP